MSLKKIPAEGKNDIRFTIQKIGSAALSLKNRAISKAKTIRETLSEESMKRDDIHIYRACLELGHFIEKEKEYGMKEIDELIERVQRLNMCLHRKKGKKRK